MPVYEYECPTCEKVFEVQQKISDQPLTACSLCGGEVRKLVSRSAFHLKGGGWYADGYASGARGKNPEKNNGENSGKTSEATKDTKPDTAKDSAKAAPSPCGSGNGSACAGCPASA
jgi:putative FmdB family regulatory protein